MKKFIPLIAVVFLCMIAIPIHAENTTLEITKFYGVSVARANQDFTLYLEINNTGTANATNVTVFLNSSPVWDNSWIQSASNNNTSNLNVSFTLNPEFVLKIPDIEIGIYNFSVYVLSNKSNQTNSSKQIEIVSDNDLIVKAGKSLQTLNYSINAPETSVYVNNELIVNLEVNNTWNKTVDLIEFTVSGINSNWLSVPSITSLEPNQTASVQIKVLPESSGTYNLGISGTAWTNVSVLNGSTSYEAFTQIAAIASTWWGFPYNAYTIDSVDLLANDWGNSKYWSYYKNGAYAMCGVGCTGGMGCPGGDIVGNGAVMELRFEDYTDWQNPTPVYLDIITIDVSKRPDEPAPSGGGGGGGSITVTQVQPEPEPEPEPIDISADLGDSGSTTVSLSKGGSASFAHSGESHSIQLTEINSDSVTLILSSEPITLNLKVGDAQRADLDFDGIEDIKVRLVGIFDGKAELRIIKLEQPAPDPVLTENQDTESAGPTGFLTLKTGFSIFSVLAILFISGFVIWYRRKW